MAEEYDQLREEFDFGYTVVGIVLVLVVMYMFGLFSSDEKGSQAQAVPDDDRETLWTLDQIKKHDGKGEDGRILIGCNGFVFDVT